MKPLVIIGTGGMAREVHQIVEDINFHQPTWDVLGFLDDDPAKQGTLVHGLPVVGTVDWIFAHSEVAVLVGIGNPALRYRLVTRIKERCPCTPFPAVVHPRAWVGNRVQMGEGVILFEGASVSTDITVGSHVVILKQCVVGHDAVIADFVTLAVHVSVSGNVHIGRGCDIGVGTSFIQGRTVGEWSIIGAGAVVIRDIPPNTTAVGVPATVIKIRPNEWYSHA